MLGNQWFKKEFPFMGLMGFGGGATGLANAGAAVPFSATGGDQSPSDGLAPGNGYIYHTFTGPGNFVISGSAPNAKDVEILMIGGGGGGVQINSGAGSGGGAGGLVEHTQPMSGDDGTLAITVGGGGEPGGGYYGAPGNPSIITWSNGSPPAGQAITALGGSCWMSGEFPGEMPAPQSRNQTCGCGAGGGPHMGNTNQNEPGGLGKQPAANPQWSPLPAFTNYGQNGGNGYADHYKWQGGGGGGVGGNGKSTPNNGGSNPQQCKGGDGRQYPGFQGPLIGVPGLNPLSGYFGGGGGGGCENTATSPGPSGGPGGPGGGGPSQGGTGAAHAQSGSGGGGAQKNGRANGGAGAEGIVIFRYPAS